MAVRSVGQPTRHQARRVVETDANALSKVATALLFILGAGSTIWPDSWEDRACFDANPVLIQTLAAMIPHAHKHGPHLLSGPALAWPRCWSLIVDDGTSRFQLGPNRCLPSLSLTGCSGDFVFCWNSGAAAVFPSSRQAGDVLCDIVVCCTAGLAARTVHLSRR